jgi:hypothetical protein
MIGQLIATLTTPVGIVFLFGGLILFFGLPIVPRTLNIFHGLSRFHIRLGTRMLKRASVVISEQGDLLLKRMSPNDIGTEEMQFADETKEFEDPHQAKSHWMGIPFAFADEVHGVLFSLRDAALGRREKVAKENDELVIKATEQERDMYDVIGWQKAVYEFPTDVYELVNLNHIRHLMTGNERSEHPQRVKTYYRNSRIVYSDGPSTVRVILLLAALIGPFVATFFIWQNVGRGGAGGSSVIGMLFLGLIGNPLSAIKSRLSGGGSGGGRDWRGMIKTLARKVKHAIKVGVVVVPLPALFVAIGYYVAPTYAFILAVIMAIGFLFIPLLVEVLKISDGLTHALSHRLLKMGLAAYRSPVWEETPSGYRLREYSQLDKVDQEHVAWHSLLGRACGFTFTPGRESWGTEVVDTTELKGTMLADGSGDPLAPPNTATGSHKSAAKTNIPSGYSIIPEKQRAVYGSMVPASIKRDKYYLWAGVALGRFRNVATGRKTFKRLEKSKEEFGEDAGLSEKSLIIAMSVLGSLSLVSGIVVFFFIIGV